MAQTTSQKIWDAAKQEAQSALRDVGTAYNDILVHGRLMSHGGGDRNNALNMEIAESGYEKPEPEQEGLFYLNHFHGHNPEPEPDIEPEM